MKIFKSVFLIAVTIAAFLSCQKELKFDDNGISAGVLKKDAGGSCLPATITGVFKVDSTLNNTQYADVQVNVTTPGTFDIKTDTVNGYSFSKTGSVVFGINTIRLYPSGKPIAAGTNTFTVNYGTSTCTFNITVIDPSTGGAVFTLGGAGGACTGASTAGTYIVGVPLTPANTLTVTVNVTTTGTYSIGAATLGGFLFAGTGVFTATGIQNVTLTGTGTPITAGPAVVTVLTPATSTCTYSIDVLPATVTAAVFTLDGAPNTCTSFILAGTYTVGTVVTAANTVKLTVTVTTAGTYSITTNSANGLSFAAAGTLALGAQTITLTATGTPAAAVTSVFKPNLATTCDFSVTAVATIPPPNTDYFPLTNPSWWSYTYSGSTAPGDTAYNVVYGTLAYNSNTYTQVQDNFATLPYDTAHYRKSGNDYWEWAPTDYYSYYIQFGSAPVYTDLNFLRENATMGTTWTTASYSGTVDDGTGTGTFVPATLKYTFTVTDPNTSITVNSVTYSNVIHMTVTPKFTVPSLGITDGATENDEYYYAKGIGLIKMDFVATPLIGGPTTETYSIKNYKVF